MNDGIRVYLDEVEERFGREARKKAGLLMVKGYQPENIAIDIDVDGDCEVWSHGC